MSIKDISTSSSPPRSTSGAVPPVSLFRDGGWVRNPTWPALPSFTPGEQKVVGLHAVWEDANFVALRMSGAYTVNWGDGVTEDVATDTTAYHEYSFADADLADTNGPVTFTDSGDLVTRTGHGYTNGMQISFATITSTTGISVKQIYYVINATDNTFQVSATAGGSAITLTTDGSGTILPYKIAVVTITPQAGQNLTSVSFAYKHNQSGLVDGYVSGWLDIKVSAPNATVLTNYISTVKHAVLERFWVAEIGTLTTLTSFFRNCSVLSSVPLFNTASVTTMNEMFMSCTILKEVPLFNTASATNTASMFYGCRSLKTVPLFNTALVINMSSMFQGCPGLETVPLFNTVSVVNSMGNMFSGCVSLRSVPLFNTASVTSMAGMFQNCYSLKEVPLFNTASVTNMQSMFSGCSSLKTVPLFNTAIVTNMQSMFNICYSLETIPLFDTSSVTGLGFVSMFQSCNSLRTVPLLDTSAATSFNNMFNACYLLESLPLFDTSSVTNFTSAFVACYSLKEVPFFDTSAATAMANLFLNCSSLKTVPLFDTALVQNMTSMFDGCTALQSVPALNCTAVTVGKFATMFNACPSLEKCDIINTKFSISYASCKLSATELNNIYTNLPTITGQTITITGNYGVAGDDPSIATAKGWTTTG